MSQIKIVCKTEVLFNIDLAKEVCHFKLTLISVISVL